MKKSKTLSAPPVGAHTSEQIAVATGKSSTAIPLEIVDSKIVHLTPVSALTLPADFDGLESTMERLCTAEVGFECGLSYVRMMQGAVLEELRKHFPETRGRKPKNEKTLKNLAFSSWEEYVRRKWRFSEETARLRVEMWKAGRPRLKKLAEKAKAGLSAVFDRPLSQLSETEFETLKNVTRKLTDGKNVRMIQEELGLYKGDAPKPLGGPRNTGKKLDRRTAEEIAQAAAMEEADLWHDILKVRLERGLDSEQKHWRWLQPEQCTTLRRLLKDLHTLMGEPLPPLHDAAKERRILKDLAQHPDAQS